MHEPPVEPGAVSGASLPSRADAPVARGAGAARRVRRWRAWSFLLSAVLHALVVGAFLLLAVPPATEEEGGGPLEVSVPEDEYADAGEEPVEPPEEEVLEEVPEDSEPLDLEPEEDVLVTEEDPVVLEEAEDLPALREVPAPAEVPLTQVLPLTVRRRLRPDPAPSPSPAVARPAPPVPGPAGVRPPARSPGRGRLVQVHVERYYPAEARERGLEGVARVQITVEPSGVVRDARLVSSSGHAILDEAALRSARSLRYRPIESARRVIKAFRFRLSD